MLLLYLDNHRTFPVSPPQLDSALVQALNLAEGGESKKTRALGAFTSSRPLPSSFAEPGASFCVAQATCTSASRCVRPTTCPSSTSTA